MKSLVKPEIRLKAYDLFRELRNQNVSRFDVVKRINTEFGIPEGAVYGWYSGRYVAWGRKGELVVKPELFYVLGALLGDGCTYNWKTTQYRVILVGDKLFAEKYADMLSKCIDTPIKAYINRGQNIWFVNINSYKLYFLFEDVRKNIVHLENMIQNKKDALLFVEGFFDAEGCVKIIKEPVRITPKICLDVCNTNYSFLELIRILLKVHLGIEARYSIQEPNPLWKSNNKQICYHLRIYKKNYVRIFFENIHTTKLKKEKVSYVNNWLNTERRTFKGIKI